MKKLILITMMTIMPAFLGFIGIGQSVVSHNKKVVVSNGDVPYVPEVDPYCAQYRTVYDAFTTPPSDEIAGYQNTMVEALVDGGYWARMDLLYIFAQHTNDAGEALINWKNPGTFNATNVTTTPFTAYEGFTGNGNHLNTGWKPSVDGANFKQDSATVGIYLRIDQQEDKFVFGVANAYLLTFRPRSTEDYAMIYMNRGTSFSGANSNSTGLFLATRTASNAAALYRNKSTLNTSTGASTGISDQDLTIHRSAYGNSNSTNQASIFFTMDGISTGDRDNLVDIFEAYMDAIGKGVI